MKKKKILFVIESLVAAGGEKSLVTLLSLLDYNRYDVDLQLFRYGGEFEQFLPEWFSFDFTHGRICAGLEFDQFWTELENDQQMFIIEFENPNYRRRFSRRFRIKEI